MGELEGMLLGEARALVDGRELGVATALGDGIGELEGKGVAVARGLVDG